LQQITIGGGTTIFSDGKRLLCKLLIAKIDTKAVPLIWGGFFLLTKNRKNERSTVLD